MLTLDTSKARSADERNTSITETGKYIGTITRAEKLVSKNKTEGLGLSFKADDGSTSNYLDIWIRKDNGDELFGLKTVNSLMACLHLKKADVGTIECEKWDRDAGAMVRVKVDGYPEIMGKRIGLLLQQSIETDQNGKDQERIGIYSVFQPDTELTASEILDRKKTPERLPKLLQSLMANPVRDNRKNKSAPPKVGASAPQPSGFGGMDDDIPF